METVTIPLSEYIGMKDRIAELEKVNQQMTDEITLLKAGRDSRTSSTAPSQDIGRSNRISLRTPSGRKPGGQPGHQGYNLPLSDHPDEIIEHFPHVCSHCGAGLQAVESVSFSRRQEIDIPPVSPLYIEHRSFIKTCPLCRRENRGAFPEHIKSPIQYGANIEAMAGYLSVYQYLPYNRISHLFRYFFHLPVSPGCLDTLLDNFSKKCQPVYDAIRERIGQSKVVGSDETGCRAGGKKHWFHVWQTRLLTFIVSFVSRGHEVIEEYFPGGFIKSFYISDCWASQLKVAAKAHQLCMAHLLRELTNFTESLQSEWSAKMKELFTRAIDLKNTMTEKEHYLNTTEEITALNQQLDELLKVDFDKFHDKEKAFVKRMIKHRQSLFTFLTCLEVPPTNNASEQAIRNIKVKTKVSGQFRNKDGKGADRYAKIRSVIDTAIKNGQDVFTTLKDIANGKLVGVPE